MVFQNTQDKSKKKRYLIIGGDGFVGIALSRYFSSNKINFITTTKNDELKSSINLFLNLNNNPSDWRCPSNISTVYFCAGITSIEFCQNNPRISNKINVDNTLKLIKQLIKDKIHVIYLSSNMVFDGSKVRTKINEITNPKTNYGKQKAQVEKELRSLNSDYITIVRFSKIIDGKMKLYKNWIYSLIQKKEITSFSDLVMSPITLNFSIGVLSQIAEKKIVGILQVSGNIDIKYSDFANLIAKKIDVDSSLVKTVKAVDVIDYYDLLPKNTTMNTDYLFKKLKVEPPNIEETVDDLLISYKRNYTLSK